MTTSLRPRYSRRHAQRMKGGALRLKRGLPAKVSPALGLDLSPWHGLERRMTVLVLRPMLRRRPHSELMSPKETEEEEEEEGEEEEEEERQEEEKEAGTFEEIKRTYQIRACRPLIEALPILRCCQS